MGAAVHTDNGLSNDSLSNEALFDVVNGAGPAPALLVCEHASNFIPDEMDRLGLAQGLLQSHIAWDPGALAVARAMAEMLDAPLLASRISRLVYDCNRPPDAASAMPARSESHIIPGNLDLDDIQRQDRFSRFYIPFRDQLARMIDDRQAAQNEQPVLVTVHSFTRVYDGVRRGVDIGILHDTDHRLADHLLHGALMNSGFNIRRNAPYGPDDGVTHTLKEHGVSRGLKNVMIEICNDLITDEAAQQDMADLLSKALRAAVPALDDCALDRNAPQRQAGGRHNG